MQNLGRVLFLLLPAFFYIAGGFHSCFVVEMRLSFKNQFSWPCTVKCVRKGNPNQREFISHIKLSLNSFEFVVWNMKCM